MLPRHLQPLFTHTSVSQAGLVNNELIFVGHTTTYNETAHTQSHVENFHDASDVRALDYNFYDFEDYIRASSPVRLDCRLPLTAKVKYERYRVLRPLDGSSKSSVHIDYKQRPGLANPVTKATTDATLLNNAIHVVENGTEIELQRVRRLPNRVGTLTYVRGLTPDANDVIPFSNVDGVGEYIGEAFVPSSEAGWLASLRLGDSMTELTCESAAWGLILATNYDDGIMLISGLRELIRQAALRGWIYRSKANEPYIKVSDVKIGFETQFSLQDTYTTKGIKEVAGNALLGYAACLALSKLVDRPDLLSVDLRGNWHSFRGDVLTVIELLALFCARSVNPVTYWASYREEAGYYSYDAPSAVASYLSDIFLQSYLSFGHNEEVHLVAGRLRENLSQAPVDFLSGYYSPFVERDFDSPSYIYESDVFYSNPAYVTYLQYAVRAYWQALHGTPEHFERDYNFALNNRNPSVSTTVLYPDAFIAWSAVHMQLNRDHTFTVGVTAPHAIHQGLKVYTPFHSHAGFSTVLVDRVYENPFTNPGSPPLLDTSWIFHIAYISFYQLLTVPALLDPFYLFSKEAHVLVTSTLAELRRMQPIGLKWFSSEAVDTVYSVIGSMLNAEAELYYKWALDYKLAESSLSPLTAQGQAARQWYTGTTGTDTIASSGYLRYKLRFLNNTNLVEYSQYKSFIEEMFDIGVTLQLPIVPPFCAVNLKTLTDTPDSYTEANQVIDLQDSPKLSQEQYFAVSYKRVNGQWAAREIPGFPVKTVPVGYTAVTAEAFNSAPSPTMLVIDGPVYLYPLRYYLMQLTVIIEGNIPSELASVTERFLPAGTLVSYQAKYQSVAGVLNVL